MIPPIWFLEIHRINVKLGREPLNQTEGAELTSMIEKGLIPKAHLSDKTVCFLIFFNFSFGEKPNTSFLIFNLKFN